MLSYILLAPVWPLPPVFSENPSFIAWLIFMILGWGAIGVFALLFGLSWMSSLGRYILRKLGMDPDMRLFGRSRKDKATPAPSAPSAPSASSSPPRGPSPRDP